MSDLPSLDIAHLQAAYRAGRLTPVELVGALCTRLEAEPVPSVWIHRVPKDQLLAAARRLRGREEAPLYGIPFAVKDNIDVAGMPTTAACPGFRYVPETSAAVVQALLDAGALCFGKLNLDQFATGLVGTRSPYGVCHNVFDAAFVSGGSSSGSALAVAAHQVSFALGTDTAGSGRVPAALNNVVGLKPTRGLLSTAGVVPACASLDCVSVFALDVSDAARVRDVMLGRSLPAALDVTGAPFRFAVPAPLLFFGAAASEAFARAVERLESLGGVRVPCPFAPFEELGDMLYGPWVVERYMAVGAFVERNPEAVLPVTRDIILSARRYGAVDVLSALARVEELRKACREILNDVDFLVLPTVPGHVRHADVEREPRAMNDRLGVFTRFANFLGVPVLSVPQDFQRDGLPFGISLVAPEGRDTLLEAVGARLHRLSDAGMGKLRQRPPAVRTREPGPREQTLRLAVVGAHMRGLALNHELTRRGGRFVRTAHTAAEYRLYALEQTTPVRPGLLRVKEGGAPIELELWDMPLTHMGEFMNGVPEPLCIGTLRLEDDSLVKGFLCESLGTEGARDITAHGGFRAYLAHGSLPEAASGT